MGKLYTRIRRAVAASAKGLFAAVLVAGGCSSLTSDEAPVDDSTFVEVMIELHLASARAQLHYERPTALRDSILARHGLDEARYEAAVSYYLERPDAYSEINEAVLDRMAAESRRLYK